jgi:hypothetical protein
MITNGFVALDWARKRNGLSLYERPMVAVYGLYSRHGRFFPPYNALPDVNYRALTQNFW